MSGSLVDRTLRVLETLSREPLGLGVGELALRLSVPKSGAHRLLQELVELGWVRQELSSERYLLTTKVLTVAFRLLAESGIVDVSQPILDSLARHTGELVRLAIVDGEQLVWVAKSQGALSGLRYDPQMGDTAHLASMASGHAWLAYLGEDEVVRLVSAQGFAGTELGPNAPTKLTSLLSQLQRVRKLGYAVVVDSSAPGVSAIAAPVVHPVTNAVLGTVSVGGPTSRLSRSVLQEMNGRLAESARQLGDCCAASPLLFARPSSSTLSSPLSSNR